MKTLMRICCVLLPILGATQAAAQAYPAKTMRIIVAFPAGGPIDIVARMLAPKLSGWAKIAKASGIKVE